MDLHPISTTNWPDAIQSIRLLDSLQPEMAVTGHGTCLQGEDLRQGLHRLAVDFDRIALPKHGRYVNKGDAESNDFSIH